MDLSICIVTLNSAQRLEACLRSLPQAAGEFSWETTVVDNHSTDQTVEMMEENFPEVNLIRNENNVGFAAGMNQAITESLGRYIVILNPDTEAANGSLSALEEFMNTHPKSGVCGPKVLNEDGTFQKSCRRGISRPWAVISYFFGLTRIFPKNPGINEYQLGHLDENEQMEVGAVSGSCMMIRRKTLDSVGNFDERYFLYQEDSDYCLRAAGQGWEIHYVPQSEIIHAGGLGGTKTNPFRSVFEWHWSYFMLYRKHFARDYFFMFNFLFYLMMGIKLVLTWVIVPFRK